LATLELRKVINVCPFIGQYILSADVTFFESKPEIFTSPSVSEDDYGYLFNREILLNIGESTFENVTGKGPLRFQDPLQTYTRRTAPAHVPPPASVSSHAQASSETITAQLPGNSTIDDLPITL